MLWAAQRQTSGLDSDLPISAPREKDMCKEEVPISAPQDMKKKVNFVAPKILSIDK